VYRHCPNCQSKDVIIFERGEDDSYCLDCSFTWRQTEGYISVSRDLLEKIVKDHEKETPKAS
jgi:hypothetical protein